MQAPAVPAGTAPGPRATAGIRARLVLLVLACVLPATGMMALLLGLQWRAGQEQLRTDLVLAARALARSVDADLEGVHAALRLLAMTAPASTEDLAAFRTQATAARQALGLDNITLSAPDGRQLLNLRLAPGIPLPQHARAEQIANIVRGEGMPFSDMYQGNVSGRLQVAVFVPVQREGRVVAVLGGTLDRERLGRVFRERPLPDTWIASVYDAQGTIVARTHEPERFVGERARPETLDAIAARFDGVFDGVTVKGTPVQSGFSRSPSTGWTVLIGIPQQDLARDLRRHVALLAGATLLLLAVSLALAFRIGSRISDAVHGLVDAAVALGNGRTPAPGRLFFREAEEVGSAMQEAAGRLKDATGSVAANELRLRTILETAQDAVVVVDGEGLVVFFNAQAERFFGCSRAEAMNRPLAAFLADGAVERANGGPVHLRPREDGIVTGRRSDGETFQMEASASSSEVEGELLTTLVLRDVTERVRAHDALVRSNLDLQQFAYVASHDLKNPLRSVLGLVELLQRDAAQLSERHAGILGRIARAMHTLEALTNDLLTYARLNGPAKAFGPVDCGQLMEEVAQLLAAPIAQAQAQVAWDALPVVHGDRTQLAQLLLNLVGNGIKYRGAAAPVVRVSAQRTEEGWLFAVADNGIGIPPEHRERVFEIFKRLHTAAEYEGSGIGLAVCRRVVQNHGGSIWVDAPGPAGGCTIRFILPDGTTA